MASHKHSRHGQRQKANHLLKRAGYTAGAASGEGRLQKADIAADDVHKHEKNMHPSKPLTKLASGGEVKGNVSPVRLDKRARGGHVASAKKKPMVTVNVINAKPEQPPVQPPMSIPMPPPGMGPAGPGAPPPGMTPPPPPPPMGGMKTGGKVATSMRDGSEGPYADIDRPTRKDVTERFYRGGEIQKEHEFEGGAATGSGRLEKASLEKRVKKG